MSIISDNLIHFLARSNKDNPEAQLEVCKKIFEKGLRTSRIIIRFPDGDCVYNDAVCFTDIPLRECNEHTAIYGKFGIGFKKSYIKNSGGNPARYFLDYFPTIFDDYQESRGGLCANLSNQFKFCIKLNNFLKNNPDPDLFDKEGNMIFDRNFLKNFVDSILYALSFDKEMGDLGSARDETKEIDLFYKEREWRLVPTQAAKETLKKCRTVIDLTKYAYLPPSEPTNETDNLCRRGILEQTQADPQGIIPEGDGTGSTVEGIDRVD